MKKRSIGVVTATLLVVASMVGSGAFTTTGMLMSDLVTPLGALLVWLVGGLIALAGALSYAELVAALPRNGGEYQLLSRLYHPAVGFVADVAGGADGRRAHRELEGAATHDVPSFVRVNRRACMSAGSS